MPKAQNKKMKLKIKKPELFPEMPEILMPANTGAILSRYSGQLSAPTATTGTTASAGIHYYNTETSNTIDDGPLEGMAPSDIGIESFPDAIHNDDAEQAFIPPHIRGKKKRHARRRATTSEEPITMSDEQVKQNSQDILEALEIKPQGGRTYVIAVAVHSNTNSTSSSSSSSSSRKGNMNRHRAVVCRHGTPFTNGYAYDQAQDAYLIQCVENMELGYVSCVFEAHMPGTGWSCSIPLPEAVLDRMLSASQQQKLEGFRERYPQPEYKIQLVQMLGCEF